MKTFDNATVTYFLSRDEVLLSIRLWTDDGEGKGRDYCALCLTETEVRRLREQGGVATDILTRIDTMGDTTLVYNIDDISCRSERSGTASVRFHRLCIPLFVWQILERHARLVRRALLVKKADPQCYDHEVRVVLSRERRARWERLYGQGSGRLRLVYGEGVEAEMAAAQAADETGTFAERRETPSRIALNSTWLFFQQAEVRWYRDHGDFYWEAYSHTGERRMNGGLNAWREEGGKIKQWTINS